VGWAGWHCSPLRHRQGRRDPASQDRRAAPHQCSANTDLADRALPSALTFRVSRRRVRSTCSLSAVRSRPPGSIDVGGWIRAIALTGLWGRSIAVIADARHDLTLWDGAGGRRRAVIPPRSVRSTRPFSQAVGGQAPSDQPVSKVDITSLDDFDAALGTCRHDRRHRPAGSERDGPPQRRCGRRPRPARRNSRRPRPRRAAQPSPMHPAAWMVDGPSREGRGRISAQAVLVTT
jgi:hypothetical protein